MGYDTGIADRIQAKGVTVVEVDGWKTRGGATHDSTIGIMHHTAGSANGATPSLAICIFGRGGDNPVPGPLVQVLQSREPIGDDKAYVIAAGKANHAGVGIWRGVSGNTHAAGVEVEHTGVGGTSPRRHEITCRILAALLEGGSRDARNVCQHFEFATPKGRKVDFKDLAPDTPDSIRARVAFWIGRTAEEDEFDMTPAERADLIADIAKASAQVSLERINAAFKQSGSVIRTESRVLARLGVQDAVDAGQPLGDWLAHFDARLGELEAKLEEHDNPAPQVPDASPSP
jgi:hypothetical protein